HPVVGHFPATARMLPRRKALGYRQVTLQNDSLLGPAGTVIRGHEFHYSEMELPESVDRTYRVTARNGSETFEEGFRVGNVLGSYIHLHF
ncbi:MAG: cobyrinic acid a,c-diamide synthase, partial [Desulfuromonadales bacterium]|nr:cobyrinic acid a,c-diamide synthase [Desulfuromonadales bacterium]NIS42814.1 cobyrinic acid a,c-diamide synthase [Desulfuromonadales bacterium]